MWADQAADKRAISVVLMMLSPVVVDGKRSVPAVGDGVKCLRMDKILETEGRDRHVPAY